MFSIYKMFKNYGFTLVELLVVISIISILAAAGTVSFNIAQVRARDSQRKADLKTIQQSLELYYGSQPAAAYPTTAQGLSTLSPNYLKVIPQDPKSSNLPYCYSSSGITYTLYANLENSSDTSRNAINASCGGQTYSNGYKVENP